MEEREYHLIQNNMQKRFQILLLVSLFILLVAVVGFTYWSKDKPMTAIQNQVLSPAQSTQPQSDTTANWKTYRNEGYRFEIKHPSSWDSIKSSTHYNSIELFSLSTIHGYKAILGIQKFPPSQEEKPIDGIKLSGTPKDVKLGSEVGLEESISACEPDYPCYARFNFYSNNLLKRGFGFFLLIPDLKKEDFAISSPHFTFDPYPFFKEDMNIVRMVLSTFKFVE